MRIICGVILLFLASLQQGNAMKKFKLSSGYEMPAVGLGTSGIKLEEMDQTITNALKNGYRHFDTASAYNNEVEIGKALRKWFDQGGKRTDLFVTSKLPPQGNRPASVEKYLNRSLQDLGLNYVDMYLIHKPWAVVEGDNFQPKKENGFVVYDDINHIALWKTLENQVRSGRVRSIGLSNFNQTQILNIYNNAEIKPSNLQVESHAYLQQKNLRRFCKEHNIVMTAYAPLGSAGDRHKFHNGTEKDLPPLLELPEIRQIAEKYKKTPGQILLRYLVQDDLAVTPKSSNAARQKENIDIFDFHLTEDEMKIIDSLDKGETGRVFDFINSHKDHPKNPQYPFCGKS